MELDDEEAAAATGDGGMTRMNGIAGWSMLTISRPPGTMIVDRRS